MTLDADDTPTIEAIAGGAGVSGGYLGIGPAFAVNQIGVNIVVFGSGATAGTVSALIQGTSVAAGSGSVQVTAASSPLIEVLAAAIGAAYPATTQGQQNSSTQLGLGFGFAINDIVNNITATIDSTTVTAGGVAVTASSNAQIQVLALGGGGTLGSTQNTGLAIAGAGAPRSTRSATPSPRQFRTAARSQRPGPPPGSASARPTRPRSPRMRAASACASARASRAIRHGPSVLPWLTTRLPIRSRPC